YAVHAYSGASYLIDVSAATSTFQGYILGDDESWSFWSLQIDTAGTWWVQQDTDDSGSLVLSGVKPNEATDTQYEIVGAFSNAADPEQNPYTESLLITYPKTLAATGMDATVMI